MVTDQVGTQTADTLATRLRALRTAHGLSRQELARTAEVHAATIRAIEEGRPRRILRSTATRLANAMGLELAALAPGTVYGHSRAPMPPTTPGLALTNRRLRQQVADLEGENAALRAQLATKDEQLAREHAQTPWEAMVPR